MLSFSYCYFLFKNGSGARHELRVRVTSSLTLEWKLYVNDEHVGTFLDEVTNIITSEQLEKSLSFSNVQRVYVELLGGPIENIFP